MTTIISNSNSVEETNSILKANNQPSYDDGFVVTFRIRKRVLFTVNFGELLCANQLPYFSTSASQLTFKRNDYEICGQAQKELLPSNTLAFKFYDKWDNKHLESLNYDELNELKIDIEKLKVFYKNVESDKFYELVKFDRSFK